MIALCLLTMLAPSRAEIREMVTRAEAAYRAQEWDTASRAFADVYVIDPNPDYLFARAQAERFAGRCNVAVTLWDTYISVQKSPTAVQEAKALRAYCEPPSSGTAPAPSTDRPNASSPGTDGGVTKKPAVPWYRDPAGGVLVATGGVSTVIGASVLGLAVSRDRKATSADTEGGYVDEKDAARKPHTAGIVVLSVGGALLVAGVVRWAIVASRSGGTAKPRGSKRSAQRVTFGLGVGLAF
jgi:hypothetical protein